MATALHRRETKYSCDCERANKLSTEKLMLQAHTVRKVARGKIAVASCQ